jgi:probable rRNA maturation factor
MSVTIDLGKASAERGIPQKKQFRQWAEAALAGMKHAGKHQLSIRIVDADESAALNHQYRHKQGPTNILSFPVPEASRQAGLLGDLAICAPVVTREAEQQQKPLQDHWAHLVIHGVLHLLGHDHEKPREAKIMETLEIRILAGLGIKDPYSI